MPAKPRSAATAATRHSALTGVALIRVALIRVALIRVALIRVALTGVALIRVAPKQAKGAARVLGTELTPAKAADGRTPRTKEPTTPDKASNGLINLEGKEMKTDKDITSPEAAERLAVTLGETNNWETEAHIKLADKAAATLRALSSALKTQEDNK